MKWFILLAIVTSFVFSLITLNFLQRPLQCDHAKICPEDSQQNGNVTTCPDSTMLSSIYFENIVWAFPINIPIYYPPDVPNKKLVRIWKGLFVPVQNYKKMSNIWFACASSALFFLENGSVLLAIPVAASGFVGIEWYLVEFTNTGVVFHKINSETNSFKGVLISEITVLPVLEE